MGQKDFSEFFNAVLTDPHGLLIAANLLALTLKKPLPYEAQFKNYGMFAVFVLRENTFEKQIGVT